MNEYFQARALFHAFLARFFENEISDNSGDMRSSFARIIGMMAAPGMLLPVMNIFKWGLMLGILGPARFRMAIVADKAIYLSLSIGAVLLLTAVVWQALLVDRRDAIVLGSFPVRARAIVGAKVASLLAYVGIVAFGMHIIAAFAYSLLLATSVAEIFRGIAAHLITGVMACMFACLAVAAFQATLLALGGPKLFSRITAPAQLALATAGILLLLLFPMIGGAAGAYVRGSDDVGWVLWLPPMWFVGVYEVLMGFPHRGMPELAWRAVLATGGAFTLLITMYPLAYRRIVTSAMTGSAMSARRSLGSVALQWLLRHAPFAPDTRAAAHFTLLTLSRVARHKLIIATALGAALALTLPFMMRWAAATGVAAVPGRSHIAVPIVFVLIGLAGLRMAFNVPSEPAAAWIFHTAVRPARIGLRAARISALTIGGLMPATVCFAVYAWIWDPWIAASLTVTLLALVWMIAEMSLRTLDFVPFTRRYNPERGNLQARWPLFLMVGVIFLQFFPWIIRMLLSAGIYWLAPALIAAIAAALRLTPPPEPPQLVDADHENKPLALRLY